MLRNWTRFHHAAFRGDYQEIHRLATSGKRYDINSKLISGTTPLHLAAQEGRHQAVEKLIFFGADVHAKERMNGAQSLYMAAQSNHWRVINILLESHADVNAISKDGTTALYVASQEGCVDAVKILLDAGADFNKRPYGGATPLHIAAQQGYVEVAKLLLQKGASIEAQTNRTGKTPLHMATLNGKVEMVKFLESQGADMRAKDNRNQSIINFAEQSKISEMTQLIKDLGPKYNLFGDESSLCIVPNEPKLLETLLI